MHLSRTLTSIPVGQWRRDDIYLPRVSVVGGDLQAQGVQFKAWGLQPQMLDFEQDFFTSGGAEDRSTMTTFLAGIRAMGANTTRIHLELWVLLSGPDKDNLVVNATAMQNLKFTLNAARQNQVYVLICGALTWDPTIVPSWYDDTLTYQERWEVQEFFWSAVAQAVVESGNSTSLLGYDLINEPYTSNDPDADWYGTGLGGYYFTHLIARGVEVDDDTVRDWITQQRDAIKALDTNGLVTFGALPFYSSPVGIANTEDLLDFLCPHIYPALEFFGQTHEESMAELEGWLDATVPLVIGETMLWSEEADTEEFMAVVIEHYDGVVAGSYGYPPEEYTVPPDPPKYPAPPDSDPGFYAIFADALEVFNSYRDEFLGT